MAREEEREMSVRHYAHADPAMWAGKHKRRRESIDGWLTRPASIGWHGNAMLVRRHIEVVDGIRITLPSLEPRGAICARLRLGERTLSVVGMHLDLSGIARRRQIGAVCRVAGDLGGPAVLMGDLNDWSRTKGALTAFAGSWQVLAPGRSFPSRRPVAMLDRIVHSHALQCEGTGVHHSTLAVLASDHLPAWAILR